MDLSGKLHHAVALKFNSMGPLTVRGMNDEPGLFSSRYLGSNGYQADFEKPKITSTKRDYFSSITWLTPSGFYSSIASSLPFLSREKKIALPRSVYVE